MINPTITLQEIRSALEDDELVFYYQPKVSMITGKVIGAEALLRWLKPDGRIFAPLEFLPLAEATGFISRITREMFQKLIVDMTIFNDIVGEFTVSFNTSAKDFNNAKLVEDIQRAIKMKLVDTLKLEIELTESSLLAESQGINVQLSKLNNLGISLIMDDFGTGFSSIDTLSKWPFSTIKLDRGVVSRMEDSNKNKTIAHTSIQMAHQLSLEVVAEGIESETIYRSLQQAGCTIGQGFWISPPLPLEDFLEFIRRDKRWPATPAGLLYLAQIDHIKWRKDIIDGVFSVVERSDPNTVFRGDPEKDSRFCSLGKWYYGSGKAFFGVPAYDALEGPHSRLHELGSLLLKNAHSNYSKAELVSIMRDLSKQSTQLIKLLQELENELI